MKTTHKKIIVSGRNVEVYEYPYVSLAYDLPPRPRRIKTKIIVVDEETKKLKMESRRRGMLRAKTQITRLVNANIGRYSHSNGKPYLPVFLTLTFKEDIKNIKAANLIFSKFIKRLNYEVTNGTKEGFLKYLVVIEFQDFNRDGVIHYHAIFFNLKFVAKKKMELIWNQGFIKIKKIDNAKNVGRYISKYMAKHFEDDRLDGRKRYFPSRGLYKPITIRDEDNANRLEKSFPSGCMTREREVNTKFLGHIKVRDYALREFPLVNEVDNNF